MIGTTSCYRKHFMLSRLPLVIRNTSCYRDYFLLSETPLVTKTTSCYRKHFLLSRALLVIERHFCQTRSFIPMWFTHIDSLVESTLCVEFISKLICRKQWSCSRKESNSKGKENIEDNTFREFYILFNVLINVHYEGRIFISWEQS